MTIYDIHEDDVKELEEILEREAYRAQDEMIGEHNSITAFFDELHEKGNEVTAVGSGGILEYFNADSMLEFALMNPTCEMFISTPHKRTCCVTIRNGIVAKWDARGDKNFLLLCRKYAA